MALRPSAGAGRWPCSEVSRLLLALALLAVVLPRAAALGATAAYERLSVGAPSDMFLRTDVVLAPSDTIAAPWLPWSAWIFPPDADGSGGDAAVDQQHLSVPALALAAALTTVMVSAVLAPMYLLHGPRGFALLVLYVLALVSVQVTLKVALNSGLPFPYTLTLFHLLTTATVCCAVDPPKRWQESLSMMPIALVNGVSLCCHNSALLLTGVGFVTMMGACTPAMTCLIEVTTGRRDRCWRLALAVSGVCAGGMACARGVERFSIVAVVLLLAAAFFRGLRSVWQRDLMQQWRDDGVEAISPCTMAGWTGLLFAAVLLPVAIAQEGTAALQTLPDVSRRAHIAVFLSVVASTVMNITQAATLRYVGAVVQHAVGNVQLAVVIVIAAAVLHEQVSALQWLGCLGIALGVALMQTTPAHPGAAASTLAPGEKDKRPF